MEPQEVCLPIQDPRFRYPSSRNPYWTKLKAFEGCVFADNATEAHAGRWRERFPDAQQAMSNRPLRVEIGTNAGHVIVEWAADAAAQGANDAFIGLDWKYKMIHKAADKCVKRGLRNLLFFRAHAERLDFMFGAGEVDSLHVYFPDPWPRKSQWKNRFVSEKRLAAMHHVLKPGGLLHIKTDHAKYFDWMLDALKEDQARRPNAWIVEELSHDLYADHPSPKSLKIPQITLFEGLFIQDGVKINSLKLRKAGLG